MNADSYVSTGQGTIGYNMFAYCLNNPVNHVDYEGTDATALLWWTESMWWFCGADLMLPVGELIYFGGMAVLGIAALDMADEGEIPLIYMEKAELTVTSDDYTDDYDDRYDDYYDKDVVRGRKKIGKCNGRIPRNNKRQNQQVTAALGSRGREAREKLHKRISGQGEGYKGILEAIEELFGDN